MEEQKRYRKGHFLGVGIAIGFGLGMPLGVAMDNIALGPALGLPIGVAIGAAMEKKRNPNPILPSVEEKNKQKKSEWIMVAIGIFVLGALAALYFLKK